jgi:hypothetical protein
VESKIVERYVTKYSIEGRLAEGLRRIGMPVQAFSELAALNGIDAGKSRLFAAFNGSRALPNELGLELWELFRRLDSLDKRSQPFKLSFNDASIVNGWLIAVKEEGLQLKTERDSNTDIEKDLAG